MSRGVSGSLSLWTLSQEDRSLACVTCRMEATIRQHVVCVNIFEYEHVCEHV